MRERERERERERGERMREKDRQRDRGRDRQTDRRTQKEMDARRGIEIQKKQTGRETYFRVSKEMTLDCN